MNRSLWEAANQNFMINQPELAAEPQEGFEILIVGVQMSEKKKQNEGSCMWNIRTTDLPGSHRPP